MFIHSNNLDISRVTRSNKDNSRLCKISVILYKEVYLKNIIKINSLKVSNKLHSCLELIILLQLAKLFPIQKFVGLVKSMELQSNVQIFARNSIIKSALIKWLLKQYIKVKIMDLILSNVKTVQHVSRNVTNVKNQVNQGCKFKNAKQLHVITFIIKNAKNNKEISCLSKLHLY